jgi:uncharacterized ferredoxin-like protein
LKTLGHELDAEAVRQAAAAMAAAVRTAPKSCGADTLEAILLDGEDKEHLAESMCELAEETGLEFYKRDGENVRKAQCILLVGAVASYMCTTHCGFCGMENCGNARKHGTTCAFSGVNLGIALGSAAGVAAQRHIDNRIMFSAGKAAIRSSLFSRRVTMAFGIPLSASGKNIFYDRNTVSIAKPMFVD